jgi:glycosyltransferase involved in cell wall biosynthesis
MNRALAVTGSYKGMTGHDNHVRSIVRVLHQQGVQIQLHDMPGWTAAKLPQSLQDPWFQQLAQNVEAKMHLYFCMPHQVKATFDQRIINYTMFESDRIPEAWVECSKSFDRTIVPVDSCKRAWIESGVPAEKIRVCPLGVDSNRFRPGLPPMKLATPDGRNAADFKVRFLNVAEVSERKNLIGLLRVWLTATNRSDDAALILKPGFYSPLAHERLSKQIAALEEELGKTMAQAAQIFWITGTLSEAMVPSLYASATHYVSASFGEGFDLPMVESAASGLQLIAPAHTAYLDYLNDEIAYMISVQSEPAQFPDDVALNILFEGSLWWRPNIDELCATISAIIAGTAPAKNSAIKAVAKLTWANTAQSLQKILFDEEIN